MPRGLQANASCTWEGAWIVPKHVPACLESWRIHAFFWRATNPRGPRKCKDSSIPVSSEGTDFGQSRFGHPDLTNFGQSMFGHRGFGPANFGQIQFCPIQFWPIHFWIWCVSWPQRVGAQTQKKGEGPKGGAPEGWRRRVEARRVERPKFRFFCPSPAAMVILSSLPGGLLVELWPRFKAAAHPKCAFGHLLGRFVRAPAACRPLGFHRSSRQGVRRTRTCKIRYYELDNGKTRPGEAAPATHHTRPSANRRSLHDIHEEALI